jgi:sensor domain CHASE-containing protein
MPVIAAGWGVKLLMLAAETAVITMAAKIANDLLEEARS